MRRHQHLLAVLLVALYGIMSTFGMALVMCVESDGSRNLEPLGATCCASIASGLGGLDVAGAPSVSDAAGDDCGDCVSHLPASGVVSQRGEASRPRPRLLGALTPPALPPAIVQLPGLGFHAPAARLRAPPPRPPAAIAALRTVILRC